MTTELFVPTIVAQARAEAQRATENFLAVKGDRDACGFAWITANVKGSTKVGRALLKHGFRKAYRGGLEMWNPSGSYTQSITAKEVGAEAAARVFRSYGIECHAGSRMD